MTTLIRSFLLLCSMLAIAGCGGPTREEWVAGVSPICTRMAALGNSLDLATNDPAKMAGEFERFSTQVGPMISELQAVEQPKDDAEVAPWVSMQSEGIPVIQGFTAALRAGDQAAAQAAMAKMTEFQQRDKAAAAPLGLPPECTSTDDAEATAAAAP